MRWLLTFLLGVLVGAGGLFAWLHSLPPRTPPEPVLTQSGHALPAPPPPAAANPIEGQLPPAPKVQPDLTEVDLPIKPDPATAGAVAAVPPVATDKPQGLLLPVQGIKFGQLSDTFNQPRGKERQHPALDIMAARGTPVLAAADGKVVKLVNSKPGGLTVYEFDPTSTYAYYYAHLDRYADGLKEGMAVKRGDVLGYVGSTGNASKEAPHLHFAVVELTSEKQWWTGTPIDPYPLLEH
ncbi:M23 family metallopeptidase [Massilia terrae]|uniref:M23 family metallopeptidase n=1 Tax=Massilia terrae TaxID=1811224 RepID=A0ABT2D244_9BURK|nr:M23 family metallopeptidase [Massilia terrae]MCS0660100.1 M23 family metallopeptidase [Massilia terrae]